MSTPELVTRVQEALAKIPHEAWCGYLTRWGGDYPYKIRCSCDREPRIAEAVARSWETILDQTAHSSRLPVRAAALSALVDR